MHTIVKFKGSEIQGFYSKHAVLGSVTLQPPARVFLTFYKLFLFSVVNPFTAALCHDALNNIDTEMTHYGMHHKLHSLACEETSS